MQTGWGGREDVLIFWILPLVMDFPHGSPSTAFWIVNERIAIQEMSG